MGLATSRSAMKTRTLLAIGLLIALVHAKKNCPKKKCPPKNCNKKKKPDRNLPAEPGPIDTMVVQQPATSWCGTEKCDGNTCAISCPLPLGYYADPNDCSAYCYCAGKDNLDENTGVRVPSRYEKCPNGLLWDPLCQGDFKWLPGGEANLGSEGGCCNWPSMVTTDHCE